MRGPRWEPVASDGKLNLRYRALPSQWGDELTFTSSSERTLDRLTWIMPLDLPIRNPKSLDASTLPEILEALAARLASILHVGKQTHFGCGTFVIG